MFDLDRFIRTAARRSRSTHRRRRPGVVRRRGAARDVERALEPSRGKFVTLYHAPDLTILNLIWPPGWCSPPMTTDVGRHWAIRRPTRTTPSTGDPAGSRPDRRQEPGDRGCGPPRGSGDPCRDESLDAVTGALHVYGGDFFATPRSEFDPDTSRNDRSMRKG